MLLMTPIKGKLAGTAAEHFGQSDGGYYLDGRELRREWGGKAAPLLGLTGRPEFEHFDHLLKGLHPQTGKQLTSLLRDDRLAGWDFTARLPKNVTAAIERGDERIMPMVWNVANESMEEVKQHAATRVRTGGKDADLITGNMLWLAVEHPEARPAKEDGGRKDTHSKAGPPGRFRGRKGKTLPGA
jgi:conjugative relaxase-like TrwC/TraI family protein